MKVGDKYLFLTNEEGFDSKSVAVVTEIHEGYAVLESDGLRLYYEAGFNDDLFKKIS